VDGRELMFRASAQAADVTSSAVTLLDQVWMELRRRPATQRQLGLALGALPDLSYEEAERRTNVGRELDTRLRSLDLSLLPADLGLSVRLARYRARSWLRESDWYWLAIDPLGSGLFGQFLPTGYCGGVLLSFTHSQFSSFVFNEQCDVDRYLSLLEAYPRLIDQFTARLAGQVERGILMPRRQIAQARGLVARMREAARRALRVNAGRLRTVVDRGMQEAIERCFARTIEPAYERAAAGLGDDYLRRAPESVGVYQYPGGDELYAALVELHTTLGLTPTAVHELGHSRTAAIDARKQEVLAGAGFKDEADFNVHVRRDPRWRATTVEEITKRFQDYLERFMSCADRHFSRMPRAPLSIQPLAAALEGSMTNGFYDAPRKDHPAGTYWFNARTLASQPLNTLGSLAYHELTPGHHLQIATQQENADLHPIRRYGLLNAYNEGWAEYAATLAEEIGLYQAPEERYGRLQKEAMLAARLVVDTGLNALRWSWGKATAYLREHTAMTENDIDTELLRYSCDIPAQALAYKVGDSRFIALRDRIRRVLGGEFDSRTFHSLILSTGAVPLSDLEWYVNRYVEVLAHPATVGECDSSKRSFTGP
jgi:uncharacterized protein (DUF885 family)